MKAKIQLEVICPECKLGLMASDKEDNVYCDFKGCKLYRVLFKAPTVELEPVGEYTPLNDDTGNMT